MSSDSPRALCPDLVHRLNAVLDRVPRLLALQDRDPDSPTRGCMHPAYWRDKSSDLADMRRQEAALSFAWIWKHDFGGRNPWKGDRELLLASLRALGFWTRNQNRDGTFDEWYRGEHGYAATAFSSYAVSLCVEALGDALIDPLRGQVMESLGRSAAWLRTHHDLFKTNHEAVGVGALAALARVLDDSRCLDAARANIETILSRVHDEGWSREISGADVGYSFLLCEYLGMHAVLSGETGFLPRIARSFEFASHYLHPDLTGGGEYGICANPYISRVAALALAPHDATAAGMVAWMESREGGADLGATLEDDLRLARYAFQPLLASLLALEAFPRKDLEGAPHPAPEPLSFQKRSETLLHPVAGLAAIVRPGYSAWVAPAGGGFLRVAFRNGEEFLPKAAHRGYVLEDNGRRMRNARYDRKTPMTHEGDTLTIEAPIAPVSFVMPPYWARVGLRIATSLPGGPKWSRWLIDKWRARKGTALNQSTAGIGGGDSPYSLRRILRFEDQEIHIEDRIRRKSSAGSWPTLHAVVEGMSDAEGKGPDEDRRLSVKTTEENGELVVRQVLRPHPSGCVLFDA